GTKAIRTWGAENQPRRGVDAGRVHETVDQVADGQRQDRLFVSHKQRVIDHKEEINFAGVYRSGVVVRAPAVANASAPADVGPAGADVAACATAAAMGGARPGVATCAAAPAAR